MKLTNTIRDAFVRAAMDDVPSIDYSEKIRAEAVKAAVEMLPLRAKAAWNDKDSRPFVHSFYRSIGNTGVNLPGTGESKAVDKVREACAALVEAEGKQNEQRAALKSRLRAVAYSVSTRKALADALPEFEKYLPADEAAALRTVPVIANVVAEFVQAGWPKGKKKAAKATA
jgi:hypothetical protein